ncbi:MAG TPA: hypothetical protein VFF42_05435 [Candidatus Eremiobacteraceae bacterium]|nr:hypothetical protein [Candidatus Eremiobacteraceae bacterium]
MNQILFCAVVLSWLIFPLSLRAQAVDAAVCDILSNPQSFDGKIVRIKGMAIAGYEEFAIQGTGCNQVVNAIWLAYPAGTKGKAGPATSLRLQLGKNNPAVVTDVSRAPVTLDKNKDFEQLDKLLSTPVKVDGLCPGCVKYMVAGTFVGRLDGTKDAGLLRDGSGKVVGLNGFGNLNRYSARLVLQSVSDISPQEIDYAKRGAALSDAASGSGSFVPGAPTADQVKRAAAAFGAEGEDNGVGVGFGVANEISKDDTTKASANSPDGLLFQVTIDDDRLKGPLMEIAMSHAGTHIADIRSTAFPNLPLFGLEFRAWQTVVVSAIAGKVKVLVLPGGYAIYSRTWSNPDLGKNANGGISGFLTNWAGTNPPKP